MATYKDVLVLVDKVSAPLKKIQGNTDKLRNKMSKLTSGLKKVGGAMMAVGATVGVVGGAILRGANRVAEMGDRIDKMSQKIGMSRKSFQEWDYIMSQNGGNVETLQMGFKTLVTQIEGVQKGSKDSIKAFRDLGVQVKDNNGKFRSADEVFNDTIRSLQKIENPTQKMILANRLFGRSAAELRPLLNQEAQAVDDLRSKANSMGLIISDEDVANSVKFKDTMDTFTRFFQAKFATVMMKLMPEFSKALEDIMAFGKENQEVLNSIGTAFSFIITKALPTTIKLFVGLANILRNIGEWIGTLIANIMSIPDYISIAFSKLKTNVINILSSLMQFIQKIIDGITWVVGKIPAVGNAIRSNRVSQTQNNNSVVNNNNITNNYGGGSLNSLTPLASGIYAIP
jgi:hypothetical protein